MIRRGRLGMAAVLVAAAGVFAVIGDSPAYADHHTTPPFPTNCPAGQAPPPDYPNPPPTAASPYVYTGPAYPDWSIKSPGTYSGVIPYEVPFKGIIFGGSIVLPPYVKIPNLYASLCGLVQLPELAGTIAPANINLFTPNVYVASLEALPVNVSFGTLHAGIDLTPAHNGGLDITVAGATTSAVSTLGMTCSITLNAKFTTKTDGRLSGQPVTGSTKNGQAEVVSNSFAVPVVVGSNSTTGPNHLCPPSIAQTFNKLLGLPVGPGVGTFVAPFCFDFELEGPNTPVATKNCPWPK